MVGHGSEKSDMVGGQMRWRWTGMLGLGLVVAAGCGHPATAVSAATSRGRGRGRGDRAAGRPRRRGRATQVYHTHGGAGALVDRVEPPVRNRSDRARRLRVTALERLHGAATRPAGTATKPLVVRQPEAPVEVAPAETLRVAVLFDPVECYNACDRFGFRVHVEVDGAAGVVEAPLDVEREEPGSDE